MLQKNKIDFIRIAKSLNTLLLIGFTVAMITNTVLASIVWMAYFNKSRTVVPPTISAAFTVSDTSIDEPYLQQMAEYFAFLKLNVTPASVDHQYKQLATYIDEADWHQMQPLLVEDAAMIKKQNISSHFTINETQIALDDRLVKITGTLNKYVGKRALEPETISYIIAMNYDHGQLSLKAIKKVQKDVK
ncbi:type IV conjugative transfer system protein TraE [Shewanella oncorhynchi]|uniref:type IV conjugative transfer system protein TraE n=1 Tax=Shewanella oncorhynchi TaxID=2726434 RepID=UPI003D7907C2